MRLCRASIIYIGERKRERNMRNLVLRHPTAKKDQEDKPKKIVTSIRLKNIKNKNAKRTKVCDRDRGVCEHFMSNLAIARKRISKLDAHIHSVLWNIQKKEYKKIKERCVCVCVKRKRYTSREVSTYQEKGKCNATKLRKKNHVDESPKPQFA